MTEYSDMIERKRKQLLAEEWANGVSSLHLHSLNSMSYDTRPQDTADGKNVIDRFLNDGRIERTLCETGKIVWLGEQLLGDDLIQEWERQNAYR